MLQKRVGADGNRSINILKRFFKGAFYETYAFGSWNGLKVLEL